MGTLVGRNVAAVLRGEAPHPFRYRPIGQLALVGKRSGVASLFGLHLSGFLPWAMWRGVYLAKEPRWDKRIRIVVDWLLDLAFGREASALPGERSDE
jgi:NADH dehydrogenase